MAKTYDEIMERIRVTPEMRRRVLEHIADISPASSRVMRFPSPNKYLTAAACFLLLLTGAAALLLLPTRTAPEPPVMTVPDIEEAASLEELSDLVGFAVETPFFLPFETEETVYRSYWKELAEVEYRGEASSATYRQSAGTDDNSGDYNIYGDTTEIAVKDQTVTLKGDDGRYVLSIWTDGTYAYSLSLSSGVSADDWRTILQ